MIAYGYRRVSTEAQGTDGFGLAAQLESLERAATGRSWELRDVLTDVASAASLERPGLTRALELVREHGGALLVPRLDRLSRSVGGFAELMDRAQAEGWALVCLDPAVDMTTPYGRAMAGMAAVFAQLERELIAQRTKEGMAAARAAGVRVGRASGFSPAQELELERRLVDGGESVSLVAREVGVPRGTLASFKSRVLLRRAAAP